MKAGYTASLACSASANIGILFHNAPRYGNWGTIQIFLLSIKLVGDKLAVMIVATVLWKLNIIFIQGSKAVTTYTHYNQPTVSIPPHAPNRVEGLWSLVMTLSSH